eukprot:4493034-Amphidinium_carterae.1
MVGSGRSYRFLQICHTCQLFPAIFFGQLGRPLRGTERYSIRLGLVSIFLARKVNGIVTICGAGQQSSTTKESTVHDERLTVTHLRDSEGLLTRVDPSQHSHGIWPSGTPPSPLTVLSPLSNAPRNTSKNSLMHTMHAQGLSLDKGAYAKVSLRKSWVAELGPCSHARILKYTLQAASHADRTFRANHTTQRAKTPNCPIAALNQNGSQSHADNFHNAKQSALKCCARGDEY